MYTTHVCMHMDMYGIACINRCPQLNSPRMLNQLSIGILGVGEIGSKSKMICHFL